MPFTDTIGTGSEPENLTFGQKNSEIRRRRLSEQWWTAREVDPIFPDNGAVQQFHDWLREHRLGRKRLLDTLLAATYREVGIDSKLDGQILLAHSTGFPEVHHPLGKRGTFEEGVVSEKFRKRNALLTES